jgi:hypothetical protein
MLDFGEWTPLGMYSDITPRPDKNFDNSRDRRSTRSPWELCPHHRQEAGYQYVHAFGGIDETYPDPGREEIGKSGPTVQ